MIKKGILTFLLFVVIVASSLAQSSAQTAMRVSVNIVSESSVTVTQSKLTSFSKGERSHLGRLFFDGIEGDNVLISNSEEVKLVNPDGEEIMMGIFSETEQDGNASDSNYISYQGIAKSTEMNSRYEGVLTTTIEYL